MTLHQIIAAGFLLAGAGILATVLLDGAAAPASVTASAGRSLPVVLPASVATDPLVPALAASGPGDPFVQRMAGQRRGTTIPLPPPPPVATPEPPLLPLIGR